MSGAPKLSLRGVRLDYRRERRRTPALGGVDLDVAEGEFVALVGPSGCGKSTLLKIVAGLVERTGGSVAFDGRESSGVPAEVGLLFQNDALLPWRTVLDNVRFPLAVRGVPAAEQRARAAELVELVGLDGFGAFFPRQLSGGMRKRVALARILAADPDVFLMDEPFGPLDAQTRLRVSADFLDLWETVGKTVLFVTHDVDEAILLADRVVVMTSGPGRVKESFDVPIPRPRAVDDTRFTEPFRALHRRVTRSLRDEVAERGSRHG
ncbi:ABC transporter ATP-binding protein [Streptomyces radicis]|uniref:ABC transporter ATP-binding protein n=1 Tax=Streptomyces radicis TaxID=1750517 RepID=A0A3A9WIV1_9ACTN|nr:ABC transporter ATP-binding protein [Streptomyces radicis]RKN12522.1 ABC transporter ATP-binding protein [Streptomyces radicis]RKN27712.1 ABC transporter ATP-binding protein [Streptomyces radicis]